MSHEFDSDYYTSHASDRLEEFNVDLTRFKNAGQSLLLTLFLGTKKRSYTLLLVNNLFKPLPMENGQNALCLMICLSLSMNRSGLNSSGFSQTLVSWWAEQMWGMMKEPLGITFPSISTSSKQVLGRLIAPTNIVLNVKKK